MNPFEELLLHYGSQSVPPHLEKLLNASKKAELEKLIRSITVTQEELVVLVHTSEKIGYKHFLNYGQWIPQHLIPSEEEKKALSENGVGELKGKALKHLKKVNQIFKERKYRVGHLFVGSQKWHLFYLDLKDIEQDNNHWMNGPHLHFTNYLSPGLSIDHVIDRFQKLDFDFGSRLHIKYVGGAKRPDPISK